MNPLDESLININVKAMLSGPIKEKICEPDFHLDKELSLFDKTYRVEIKVFVQTK